MNNPAYLDLSISDMNKTVVHESSYNYIKPKYGEQYLQRHCRRY